MIDMGDAPSCHVCGSIMVAERQLLPMRGVWVDERVQLIRGPGICMYKVFHVKRCTCIFVHT